MDATIRNLDAAAYRSLKAWAAQQGLGLGEALSELVRLHLGPGRRGGTSLADWPTLDLGPGSERLSEEVDHILYGSR